MAQSVRAMQWTNRSVVRFAGGEDDPVGLIERKARALVLRARDAGWEGPPFNPLAIAKLLNITAEANADVIDARTISNEKGLRIQFNPTQPRERQRFSIAHEIAHALFPDVGDAPRHRGGDRSDPDDWQLEMLCNLAAAEFVMPMGSLPTRNQLPGIEELIKECRRFDVSVEAFLIRVTKVTNEPIIMFCASPTTGPTETATYRIDYTVLSSTAPNLYLAGRAIAEESSVYGCTAIGYTDHAVENWFGYEGLTIECVGIPRYPGAQRPRVAGLIRFRSSAAGRQGMKLVHGDVLDPRTPGGKIICQLVNDQARTWGGGVARSTARRYPKAQELVFVVDYVYPKGCAPGQRSLRAGRAFHHDCEFRRSAGVWAVVIPEDLRMSPWPSVSRKFWRMRCSTQPVFICPGSARASPGGIVGDGCGDRPRGAGQ